MSATPVPKGWGRIELLASVGLTVAALAVAAAVVHGEFVGSARSSTFNDTARQPAHYSNWQVLDRYGRSLDQKQGPIKLVEFADLECPACKNFASSVLPEIQERFSNRVSVTFIHLPLRMHRFAAIAAQAAECAAEQHRFAAFVRLTYERQDSLGLIPWWSLAHQAGATDSAAFARCAASKPRAALIDSGAALAKRLGISATPTVVINGWRLSSPSPDEVERVVDNVLHQKLPYANVAQTLIK